MPFRRFFMKLFVTDLDGTLLNSDHKCTDYSINAINTAMKMGIKVCIATGRSYGDILELISGLDDMPYIISSNGASIYHADGKKLHSISIPKDQVKDIISYLKYQGLEFEVATDEYTYVTQPGLDILNQELEDLGDISSEKREELTNDVLGLVLSQGNLKVVPTSLDLLKEIDSANSISSISAYLNKINDAKEYFSMDSRIRTFTSWKYNFEMTSSKTSKGIALEFLCDHLDISLLDVAAIGDNYNDLSMIKIAGIKGGMENAVPNLLSISDFIAPSNDKNGSAKFLYKLMDDMGLIYK